MQIVFQGSYTFGSEQDVKDALASVKDLVGDEDPGFRQAWRAQQARWLRQDGLTLHVEVDVQGPEDWYDAIEAICDELADEARSGRVTTTAPEGDAVIIDAEEVVADEP